MANLFHDIISLIHCLRFKAVSFWTGGKGGVVIPFHAQILTKFTRHVLNQSLGTFSITFTANFKRLLAVWGFPFAVVTKIDFSMALTSFDGKRWILGEIFIFFKVFWDKAIHPFSTSSPWEHNGFSVFRKNRGKNPRNLLIISGTFWPSLGQFGR